MIRFLRRWKYTTTAIVLTLVLSIIPFLVWPWQKALERVCVGLVAATVAFLGARR